MGVIELMQFYTIVFIWSVVSNEFMDVVDSDESMIVPQTVLRGDATTITKLK